MSVHLPIRTLRPLYRPNAFRYAAARPFSTTIARHGRKAQGVQDRITVGQALRNQTREHKSRLTMQQEMMETDSRTLNEDLGLLPGTFVRGNAPSLIPSGNTSWVGALKTRGKYEWRFIKAKWGDFFGRIYFWARFTNWAWRNKPRFKRRAAKNAAMDNYERMYTAFAAADIKELEKVCISGLVEALEKRLSTRPADATFSWRLLKRDRSPRIVSNRAVKIPIPGEPENRTSPTGVRQVVVRIRTIQQLTISREDDTKPKLGQRLTPKPWRPDPARLTWHPMGALEAQREYEVHGDGVDEVQSPTQALYTPPVEREVVEYIVMHQRTLRGKEEEWKIWGFIKPTTLQSLAKSDKFEEEFLKYQDANPGVA